MSKTKLPWNVRDVFQFNAYPYAIVFRILCLFRTCQPLQMKDHKFTNKVIWNTIRYSGEMRLFEIVYTWIVIVSAFHSNQLLHFIVFFNYKLFKCKQRQKSKQCTCATQFTFNLIYLEFDRICDHCWNRLTFKD